MTGKSFAPSPLPYVPLIIIGAGRSGTNILRDTLCRLSGFATWNCDEINPIWRHGNIGAANDEYSATMARPRVKSFIRRAFSKQWRRLGRPEYLVEKTCANSLRVPFVDAIFPEAKFLFIVRDGLDVVASAEKRWRGELELQKTPYYLAKVRHTPMVDLPAYAFRFVRARLGMILGKTDRLSFWGPQFADLAALPAATPLSELCAHQWVRCVGKADMDLSKLDSARVHRLRYEDLAREPAATIQSILAFLGVTVAADELSEACRHVSGYSVGKGRSEAKADDFTLRSLIGPTSMKYGYRVEGAQDDAGETTP